MNTMLRTEMVFYEIDEEVGIDADAFTFAGKA
jgi:hypothetical protein